MYVPATIKEDGELWKSYAARSEKELIAGTMLWVTVPEEVQARHLTFAEWEYLRALYKRAAKKEMRERGAEVAVYAMADLAEDGGIACGHLGVNVMSREEYERFAKSDQKSMCYAIVNTQLPLRDG